MADHIAGSANNAIVLAANSESSEVTCSCCVKLKMELEKTLMELKSMQKVVECCKKKLS
jgi:hypothetical protein